MGWMRRVPALAEIQYQCEHTGPDREKLAVIEAGP